MLVWIRNFLKLHLKSRIRWWDIHSPCGLWVAGAQDVWPLSAAVPDALAGSWMGSRATGTQTGTLMAWLHYRQWLNWLLYIVIEFLMGFYKGLNSRRGYTSFMIFFPGEKWKEMESELLEDSYWSRWSWNIWREMRREKDQCCRVSFSWGTQSIQNQSGKVARTVAGGDAAPVLRWDNRIQCCQMERIVEMDGGEGCTIV